MSKYAFLADENFPRKAVESLQKKNIDIVSVSEIAPGAKNGEVARLAVKGKRVLLTFDKDFGEWVYKEGISVGVVLFRLSHFNEQELVRLVSETLLEIKENLQEAFTVVESDRVRIVPLPK